MAYIPVEDAVVGTRLAVEYIGELYPVTVAAVGSTGVYDPDNALLRS
jgi:hypothetical protein